MDEKRRAKRVPAHLSLTISSLFKQDNEIVININAPIEVIDVSRTGIGFKTESRLPVGYYFNANLELGSSESSIFSVVKIVRTQVLEGKTTIYGCEFVGLAPVFHYIFDEYEKQFEEENE
ncbi:PilZ domain-containing protein [Anaeromicropila populeti]|uniref:PilZ domain-containing protein n=1 Tax=Anaeromicropila populeti TaxID=37658 RepID=A0A1I6LIV8_9FIRM|nr:PilZ domain-containing protein [Anaeromicropila populeti]SFS03404.1 PilZ domain-containing protein [Anaeromicropila populeti]